MGQASQQFEREKRKQEILAEDLRQARKKIEAHALSFVAGAFVVVLVLD